MTGDRVVLHQFRYSHYNEKARWALDYKGVTHARKSYLPGPHRRAIARLTGQTMTPVVQFDDIFVSGSARIIDELERRFPEPAFYPADPTLRQRALEIQSWFDNDIGPRIRRSVLNAMLSDPGYLCRMFAEGQPAAKRMLYRAVLPLAERLIRKGNGITGPESVEDGNRAATDAFEFVAREAGPEGYLAGSAFSVAHLTAASLLAPAADPPDSEMTRPRPMPAAASDWLSRWVDHPGRAWVLEIYRRHRNKNGNAPGLAA